MIQSIYGRRGFVVTSYKSGSYNNIAIFYDTESEIEFKQSNSSNEGNNGFISSKTVGWRTYIDAVITNIKDGDYENIESNLVSAINDYLLYGYELRVFPRISIETEEYIFNPNQTPYYVCEFGDNFDIEDLFERVEKAQSISLSFKSKENIVLPYYMFDGFPMTGVGSESNPFGIYNTEGMIYLSQNDWLWIKGYYFKLLSDIDMGSVVSWTPIGQYSPLNEPVFNGHFDGNNKKLSNFNFTCDNASNIYKAGLFGNSSSSTFKDLYIDNFSITNNFTNLTSYPVSAGVFNGGKFFNIKVSNTEVYVPYSRFAGILSSTCSLESYDIIITDSSVIGSGFVGGLCGIIEQLLEVSNVNIINCQIENKGNYLIDSVGGVIGSVRLEIFQNRDTIINNIFVDEDTVVIGRRTSYIGGVFGVLTEKDNSTKLSTVSNIKSLSQINYDRYEPVKVGGFSGGIGNFTPTITDVLYKSIFCSNVFTELGGSQTINIGGCVGYSTNPITTNIDGIYFDKTISILTASVIGIGKNTTQLYESILYTTYNRDYWTIIEGQYPQLNIENKRGE